MDKFFAFRKGADGKLRMIHYYITSNTRYTRG